MMCALEEHCAAKSMAHEFSTGYTMIDAFKTLYRARSSLGENQVQMCRVADDLDLPKKLGFRYEKSVGNEVQMERKAREHS